MSIKLLVKGLPVATGIVLINFGVVEAAHAVNLTPIRSALEFYANANARSETVTDPDNVSDTDSDIQFGTVNSLGASVSALSVFDSARVLATGAGTATWVNSSQGEVNLFDIG